MNNTNGVEAPGLAMVDTAALAVLLRSKVPIVVLDARSDEYDDGRRIPGATRLSPDSSAYQVDKAVGHKDTLTITYCSNLKCTASMKLHRHLKNLGYENVLEYPDGLAGWQAAGYPVEQESQRQDSVSRRA